MKSRADHLVVGVLEDALEVGLAGLLHRGLDLGVAGLLDRPEGQVHARRRSGSARGRTCR